MRISIFEHVHMGHKAFHLLIDLVAKVEPNGGRSVTRTRRGDSYMDDPRSVLESIHFSMRRSSNLCERVVYRQRIRRHQLCPLGFHCLGPLGPSPLLSLTFLSFLWLIFLISLTVCLILLIL